MDAIPESSIETKLQKRNRLTRFRASMQPDNDIRAVFQGHRRPSVNKAVSMAERASAALPEIGADVRVGTDGGIMSPIRQCPYAMETEES